MGEVRLQGIGVSRGVGIGTAVVLKEEELKIEHILVEDEEKEIPTSGPGSVAEIISERRMYGKLVN